MDFCEEDARKTVRFKQYGTERSLGCGCNHAQYELRAEGAVISNDTLGRYLKAKAATKIELNMTQDQVKVLAVDDINLRKGDKKSGCTVLLDEQTRKVFIILKGTTKEITKQALMASIPAAIFIRDGDGWLQASPETPADLRSYFYVPDGRVEESIKYAGLTSAKAQKYRNTLKLLELADLSLIHI